MTCEPCGEREHNGRPCYAELRMEWIRQESDRKIEAIFKEVSRNPEIDQALYNFSAKPA
jgi:hypothetical protein